MNKTIEYAVNEALKIGRLSANVKFFEAELREQIAQQIETLQSWTDDTGAVVMYKDRVLYAIRNGL